MCPRQWEDKTGIIYRTLPLVVKTAFPFTLLLLPFPSTKDGIRFSILLALLTHIAVGSTICLVSQIPRPLKSAPRCSTGANTLTSWYPLLSITVGLTARCQHIGIFQKICTLVSLWYHLGVTGQVRTNTLVSSKVGSERPIQLPGLSDSHVPSLPQPSSTCQSSSGSQSISQSSSSSQSTRYTVQSLHLVSTLQSSQCTQYTVKTAQAPTSILKVVSYSRQYKIDSAVFTSISMQKSQRSW